jgi:hypothetical protein
MGIMGLMDMAGALIPKPHPNVKGQGDVESQDCRRFRYQNVTLQSSCERRNFLSLAGKEDATTSVGEVLPCLRRLSLARVLR